jgi:hypothetical protein
MDKDKIIVLDLNVYFLGSRSKQKPPSEIPIHIILLSLRTSFGTQGFITFRSINKYGSMI